MRLRLGLVAGFAAGAYIATIAQQRSRQLSQQMNQKVNRGLGQTVLTTATEKAKAAANLGVERARDAVASRLGDQGVRPLIQTPSRLAAQHRNGNTTSERAR